MPKKVLRTAFKTALSFFISVFIIYSQWRTESITDKTDRKVEKGVYSEFKPWYFEGGSLRPRNGAQRLRLWPSETTDDRILNQLMFTPEKEPRLKKRIFFTKLQNLKFQSGSNVFHDLKCPVRNCEIVFNHSLADAVVFENFITRTRKSELNQKILESARYLYNPIYGIIVKENKFQRERKKQKQDRRKQKKVWILHSLESPLFSGKVIQETSVNWTASYRLDSDLVTPYDKWVYYDENYKVKAPQKNYAAGKTKKVAWFVSNCHSKNKRLEYAKILAKYIPVDIYGACGDKVCLKNFGKFCREIISRNYKFYLSFENANCRDYITEKFYSNALRLDVIPIVMGAPKSDYEKVAPHNSFIHVEDFLSPKHLAEYLNYLDKNDADYNSYFQWKGTGEFINTYFMCRLCALLHAERSNHFYEKISHWWRRPGICTKSFWNNTNRGEILRSLRNVKKITAK